MLPVEENARALMLRRLMIFALISLACFLIAALLATFVMRSADTPHVRVATVIQDVVMFIVPALATAVICSRYPARFLSVDKAPGVAVTLMAVAVLLVSAPAQNVIVEWNKSLSLPASLQNLQRWMDAAEASAADTVRLMLGAPTVSSLIMSILILGILAGFSEELFFRGTLQKIIAGNKAGSHAAVWITGFVFSAFHFQFYGFVPRLLLGVYFGYLVWWSRSLWLPVIVHAVNNSAVAVSDWYSRSTGNENVVETVGTDNVWIVAISLVLTVAGLWIIRSMTQRRNAVSQISCDKK